MAWLDGLSIVVVAAVCAIYSRFYLHMMQLESYQLDGYRRWLSKNRDKLLGWTLNLGVLATLTVVVLQLLLNMLMGESCLQGGIHPGHPGRIRGGGLAAQPDAVQDSGEKALCAHRPG